MASPIPAAVITEIRETVGVLNSAKLFIDGNVERLAAAVAAALANGATAEELEPITAELEAQKAAREAVAAAIAANP